MAAAANKPGPVHYALVFFVVCTVVLGIMTYMYQKDATDKAKDNLTLTDENAKINKAYRALDEQAQAIKKIVGVQFDLDDPNNAQNQSTVSWSLKNQMALMGKDVVGKDAIETLKKLREALDAASADRDSKATKVASLEKDVLALGEQYQKKVDNFAGQAKASERDKRDVVSTSEEKINTKIQEIAQIKSELAESRTAFDQEKESRSKERKELNSQISKLESIIDTLRGKIDDLEKLSFEFADGLVTRVEHSNHTVWINLGADDFLKERMTFSVYSKENQGVGRGVEDIKGKIEVTRIMSGHMAEARIIDEDLYRPLVSGDLLYSPIWTPGLVEKISVIGPIHLGDDKRDDRQQFHELMKVAGAVIDNEVDDEGNRTPPDARISVQTRFLVKGDIPDLVNASTDEEKARITKIDAHLHDMTKEARMNGVRVIKLNDFLAYIGYQNKRRTFLPGQQRPFMLKAGAASSTTKGESNDRTSTGRVSRLYDHRGERQKPQDKSTGTTSSAYGGSK